MKKKIFSLLLAIVMLISAVPFASATETNVDPDAEYTVINTYDEFIDFLDHALNYGAYRYYKLGADINADGEAIGEYEMSKIVFDGDGHKITGLNIENALFSSIEESYFRNVTFESATAEGVLSGKYLDTAVLAQSVTDSYITNIVFSDCEIKIPSEGDLYVAFVAANNTGYITNCIVDSNCVITADTEYIDESADILIGGITANNTEDGFVTNCISQMQYTLADGPYYTVGGIVAMNKAIVSYCYADIEDSLYAEDFGFVCALTGGDYYNQFLVYKNDGQFNVSDTVYTKNYSAMDVYEFAAEMSETVMNDNINNIYGKRDDSDLPALWSVENNDLCLSFDGKTAQVYFTLADDLSGNFKVNGFAPDPYKDISFAELYSSDYNMKEVIAGKKFSVRVGKYNGSNYVRNTVTVSVGTLNSKVVNNFVLRPVQQYVKNMPDIFDSTGANYSDVFLNPKIQHRTTDALCSVSVPMYPFCSSLSLSNVSQFDELRYLFFKGEGTQSNPFEISSAYELNALSDFVNSGLKFGSLNYNEAYYILTDDIDLKFTDFNPIGTYSSDGSTAFRGNFNGDGHYILNLYIITSNSYAGLFGIVKGKETDDSYEKAVVKNLTVYNADIADADTDNVGDIKGIIAAQAEYATIQGCVARGGIIGGTSIGGLVGYSYHTDIINCGVDVNVYSVHQWARLGGVVGNAEYTNIINTYAIADTQAFQVLDESYIDVGIIAGRRLETTYTSCYYNSQISSFEYSDLGHEELNFRFSKYSMTLTPFMEELLNYSAFNGYDTTYTQSEYGSSIPVASSQEAGQYIASCESTSAGSLKFTYFPDVSWKKYNAGRQPVTVESSNENEITGIIVKDFNNNIISVDYDFEDGVASFIMPYQHIKIYPSYSEPYLEGEGTKEDPYLIWNYDDIVNMAERINNNIPEEEYREGYYLVMKDIDCDGRELPLIGYHSSDSEFEHAFKGTFDGNGHTISNATIYTSKSESGWFYALEGAEIRDIYFSDISLTLKSSLQSGYHGNMIARYIVDSDEPSRFVNISMEDCLYMGNYVTGSINTYSFSYLAGRVYSDVEFINCLFKDSYMKVYNPNEVSGQMYLYSSDDGNAKITLKNILVLSDYTKNYVSLIRSGSTDNIVSQNVYYTNKVTSVNTSTQTQVASYMSYVDGCSYETEYIMNRYARNNLLDYVPASWASINNETDMILGISDDISFEYDIIYDDVFTTSATKLIDMEYAPVKGSADHEIAISFFADADAGKLTIKTASGENVPFTTDLAYQEAQFGVIRFRMPWEEVFVSYSDDEINPLLMRGTGRENDPYVIEIKEHLVLVANVINGLSVQYKPSDVYVDYDRAYYILEKDIDMTGVTWDGIGTSDIYFSGQIDGQGNYIKFLNKNTIRPEGKMAGLFTRLESTAVIINLKLLEAYVYNTDTYHNAAGAVAMLNYGRIEKCMLFNVSMKNDGLTNAGAIAGRNLGFGIIENCAVINSTLVDSVSGDSGSYIAYFNASSVGNCIIYDCFWNSTNYDIGVENGIKPERIYHNSSDAKADTKSYTIYKSDEQFASGEVTYLLNNAFAIKENVWRQNLPGFEPVDDYPILEQNHRVVDFDEENGYYNRQDIQSSRYAMVGDINVDGLVQPDDLITLYRFFGRSTAIKLRGMIAADINADGILDKNDFDILEKYIKTGEGKDEYRIGTSLPITYRMPVNVLYIADMNGDFEINETDLSLHREYMETADTLDDNMKLKLDINLDGQINDVDTESIELYLEAVSKERSYGGFPGKVGYIGEKIVFDDETDIPGTDDNEKEDVVTPEEDEDDGICDICSKEHNNFIVKLFCFIAKLFVMLLKFAGIC